MRFTEWEKDKDIFDDCKLASNNNEDAFNFLIQQGYCIRVIDDFYDEDKPVTKEEIFDVFELLFSVIPSNPFYQKYIKELGSLSTLSWEAWKDSNRLCKGSSTDKIYAHVYRDQIELIIPLVALLTQGYEKMVEVRKEQEHLFSDKWIKSLFPEEFKKIYVNDNINTEDLKNDDNL